VRALRWPAARFVPDKDYAAIGETLLFTDLVVVPTGGLEFRQNEIAAGVGLGNHSCATR